MKICNTTIITFSTKPCAVVVVGASSIWWPVRRRNGEQVSFRPTIYLAANVGLKDKCSRVKCSLCHLVNTLKLFYADIMLSAS